MNRLATEKRRRVLAALVEGNSIRSTVRMTGVAKNTVIKLLREIGKACQDYHNRVMVNLSCDRIQLDEIWSFCYAKEKNLPPRYRGRFGYGDVWTWVAIDADTKLVPSWLVGGRGAKWANLFVRDLAARLRHRIQLTTDGHRAYLEAVEGAFGGDVDYATLVKLYGVDNEKGEHRYSPARIVQTEAAVIVGAPSPKYISTSFAER